MINNKKQITFSDNSFTIIDNSSFHRNIKCLNILDNYEAVDKLLRHKKIMFEIYTDENATRNLGQYGVCYLRNTVEPTEFSGLVKSVMIADYWTGKRFNGYNYISVIIDFLNKKVEIYGNGDLIRTEVIPDDEGITPMSLCAGSCLGDNMYFNFGQKDFKMKTSGNVVSMNDFYFNSLLAQISNIDIDMTDTNVNIDFNMVLSGSRCANKKIKQKIYKNIESEENLIETKYLNTKVSINNHIHLDELN